MYPRPLSHEELFNDKAIKAWKEAERAAKASGEQLRDDGSPTHPVHFGYEQQGARYNWRNVGEKPDYFSDASIKAYRDRQKILGEIAMARQELDNLAGGHAEHMPDRPRITLDETFGGPRLAPNGMITAFFSDGVTRRIETRCIGPEDAMPVIWIHGTPGSNDGFVPGYNSKYRIIAANRPGYGGSTRHADRIIADGADWILAIAKAYGYKRFIVAGRSGAGPYVIAAAAFCPGVTCAVDISSLAPRDEAGEEMTAARGNVSASSAALDDRPGLWTRFKEEDQAGPYGVIEKSIRPDAGPADTLLLEDPEIARQLAMSHSAGGPIGRYDDIIAMTRRWGVPLEDISAPVVLVHGKKDVFTTPDNYYKLKRRIPNVEGYLYDDLEHLGTSGRPTEHALLRAVEISNG